MLDISSLIKIIDRLAEGLARYDIDRTDTQIRDGLIQRFEFTYELSHKMLKRYLELASASPVQFDGMTFQDLIRTANEQGLLFGQWSDWRQYRDMRSKTSHTYDEDVALIVVQSIPAFLKEAVFLKERLAERVASPI